MEYKNKTLKKLKKLFKDPMKDRREEDALVSLAMVQVILLIPMVLAVSRGQHMVAVVILIIILLGLFSKIWARLTVRRLKVSLKASKTRMFPGDRATLTWNVRNEKSLPVLWVDVVQPLREPFSMIPLDEEGQPCVEAVKGLEKNVYGASEKENIGVYKERCSMIGGHTHAGFDTVWEAKRRGLYTLEDTRIYSGDGFGMVKYRLKPESGSQRSFIIFPKIVAVDAESFMKNMWEGDSGGSGFLEDPSIIKLTRPYENTDSLKKINWRMVARGQEMTVNQYEVVSPHALHFIVDCESFNGPDEKGAEEFESSLEVLASLLMALGDRKMRCGFSFPQSDELPAVNLFAGGGSAAGNGSGISEEIMYRMAAYKLKKPVLKSGKDTVKDVQIYLPSEFAEETLLTGDQQVAKYFFVTRSASCAAQSGLLRKLEGRLVEVLTYETLMKLKKGE